MKNKGNLYILITAFLWSLGGIFIKLIPINPIAINGIRSLVALIFFFIYEKNCKIKINKMVILASICLVGTNTLYVVANKLTTAANAIILEYTAPIFVLIYTSILTKRLPSKARTGIILLAFIGMVLFFFDQMDEGQLLGNVLAIISGMFFAGVFFFNSFEESSSPDASKLAFLISFIISIPFFNDLHLLTLPSVASLIALGVFQVGLAYVFFSKGIKKTTPINSSLISLVEALLNPIWVLIFIGEKPSLYALIGSAIVLIAIILNILLDNKISKEENNLINN